MVTQQEYAAWLEKNYGTDQLPMAMFKLAEEFGELNAAVYRGEVHKVGDALGDVYITLLRVAEAYGLNFEACVYNAWDDVKQRDYIKYPDTGKPRRTL
jgi:hypothetical protein